MKQKILTFKKTLLIKALTYLTLKLSEELVKLNNPNIQNLS